MKRIELGSQQAELKCMQVLSVLSALRRVFGFRFWASVLGFAFFRQALGTAKETLLRPNSLAAVCHRGPAQAAHTFHY